MHGASQPGAPESSDLDGGLQTSFSRISEDLSTKMPCGCEEGLPVRAQHLRWTQSSRTNAQQEGSRQNWRVSPRAPRVRGRCLTVQLVHNRAGPKIMVPIISAAMDSNTSAILPALRRHQLNLHKAGHQSPTLSPTRSATTAGLRGSSSGMPTSTLPMRSAPTSAALV
jgi:hypothetical protein